MKICLACLISIKNKCFSCHLPAWDSTVANESAQSLLRVLRILFCSVLHSFYEQACWPQVNTEPVTELGREPGSWCNGLLGANLAGASGFCSKRRLQVCCVPWESLLLVPSCAHWCLKNCWHQPITLIWKRQDGWGPLYVFMIVL